MKAICLRARGGHEALAYEEAPQPHPGEGEVLVRVHAAGVIHTELSWVPTWTTRAGEPRPLPVIPGHEFSGEIAALGAGAHHYTQVTKGPLIRHLWPTGPCGNVLKLA